MSSVASCFALVVAVTFVAAAVAKFRSPAATASAFSDLGVSVPVAAVALVELGLAGALAAAPRVGGPLAAAALVAFTAVLVRGARGSIAVRCGCFGSGSAEPVGPATFLRNALLVLAALGAGLAPRFSPSVPGAVVATAAATAGLVVCALVRLRTAVGSLIRGAAIDVRATSARLGANA